MDSGEKLSGHVEADETFTRGKAHATLRNGSTELLELARKTKLRSWESWSAAMRFAPVLFPIEINTHFSRKSRRMSKLAAAPDVPGSTEAERFDNAVRKLFTVSKEDSLKGTAEETAGTTEACQEARVTHFEVEPFAWKIS